MKYLTILFVLLVGMSSTSCTKNSNKVTSIVLHGYHKQTTIGEQKGKLLLITFGYTHCPDICPTSLLNVATALDKLSDTEKGKVQPLFITLDPERDEISKLNEYAGYFHPMIFASYLDKSDEKTFLKHFQVEYFKDSKDDDYLINHTSYIFLIDDHAKILDMMGHQTDPADIAKAIRSKL